MSEQLDRILDQVHSAILAGKFGDLEEYASRLTDELDRLSTQDFSNIQDVQTKSKQVEICILSAIQGLSAANYRIGDIRRAAAGLTTYGQDGRSATLIVHARPSKRI